MMVYSNDPENIAAYRYATKRMKVTQLNEARHVCHACKQQRSVTQFEPPKNLRCKQCKLRSNFGKMTAEQIEQTKLIEQKRDDHGP